MKVEARLRMLASLQARMDFEDLAAILIKRDQTDLLFTFFSRKDLKIKNKQKAVISAFKQSLIVDEYALALRIWSE